MLQPYFLEHMVNLIHTPFHLFSTDKEIIQKFGARDSLRGSMELLDKSLNILDSTTVMRQAGRTMKDTIDNELDKFDTDNRFLFMDPSADKVSFTSDRNKPPKTLQIVMRTDEISVDDDTAKTADAEVAKAKESPLRRMWNVLVQMWKAMVSIFKNR